MPRAIDPSATFDTWLDSDSAKPPDQRPVFTFKVITGRDAMKLLDLYDEMQRGGLSGSQALQRMYDALAANLTGWRNMGRAFDATALPDILDLDETRELFAKMQEGSEPTGDEAGKSGSQP